MAFFLGVVAAVLLVLVLAAVVAFWFFKRWLRRKLGDAQRSAALVDPRWHRPARIQLDLAHDAEHGEAFDSLWVRCHALGFRTLADWSERNGAYGALRAARHETLPLGLVITENCDGSAAFAMLAMSATNALTVYSDAQDPALVTSSMTWDVDAAQTPESAFARLEALVGTGCFRDPELRLVEAVFERAWATRLDAQIATAPVRADIERRAHGSTAT
ncbi:MAG TPA: hypothetical protein VFO79_10610, partial [Xanthomonadales bacterium]|nr:hypothetical protein [Xanthomonadales bacterium]